MRTHFYRLPNDDGDHDEPFDVTAVPELLNADDAPSQYEVQHAMYGHGDGQPSDHLTMFNSRRPTTIRFNELQLCRQRNSTQHAISTLSGRHQLLIEDDHRVDHTDPNTVLATGPHFLDFVMYIGGHQGLDSLSPNVEVDQTWSFQLDFSMIRRLWPKGKSSTLPFDSHGRLMHIGKVHQEQVWLVMAPNEWLQEDPNFNATGNWPILPAQTTAMETQHSMMIMMFIAKMLADRRVQDIHCNPEYPGALTCQDVNDACELL